MSNPYSFANNDIFVSILYNYKQLLINKNAYLLGYLARNKLGIGVAQYFPYNYINYTYEYLARSPRLHLSNIIVCGS